jgi:hypothetical protein
MATEAAIIRIITTTTAIRAVDLDMAPDDFVLFIIASLDSRVYI